MIFDHRTYACRPNTLKLQMALYEQHGYAPQRRILGEPFLFATTETGDVNTYVHVWAYESAADRAEKRAALWADPEWLTYVAKSGEEGYLVTQNNKILQPAPFFDPKAR